MGKWQRPRERVLEALRELDREVLWGAKEAGAGSEPRGDREGEGFEEPNCEAKGDVAELALERIRATYESLKLDLHLLSGGELSFSSEVLICSDGSMICEEFGLLGSNHAPPESDPAELVDRLVDHLEETGMSVAEAARQLGRASTTLYGWLSYRTEPSPESCERLKECLAKWE